MFVAKSRLGERRFGARSSVNVSQAPAGKCVCEPLENRMLLSGAMFAAPRPALPADSVPLIVADAESSGSLSPAMSRAITPTTLVPIVAATTLPGAVVAGTAVRRNVTVELTNPTSSEISATNITVLASSDGSTENATALVSKVSKHGISIKAGQTKKLKLAVKAFPANTSSGTYELLVEVSSSPGQNSSSSTGPLVNVAAPFVQFGAGDGTGIVKPSPAKIGKNATLTLVLINNGNIPSAAATIDVGLTDTGDTPATTDLKTLQVHFRIRPGHTGVLHLHVTVLPTVLAGGYNAVFSFIGGDGNGSTIVGRSITIAT